MDNASQQTRDSRPLNHDDRCGRPVLYQPSQSARAGLSWAARRRHSPAKQLRLSVPRLTSAVEGSPLQPWIQRSDTAPYGSSSILSDQARVKPAAFCMPGCLAGDRIGRMLRSSGLEISNSVIFGHPGGMTGRGEDERNGRPQHQGLVCKMQIKPAIHMPSKRAHPAHTLCRAASIAWRGGNVGRWR